MTACSGRIVPPLELEDREDQAMKRAWTEEAIVFECDSESLVGIMSRPVDAPRGASTGVIIVVGGPQYRAGSHRMFVKVARAVAASGYPALRFDVRGMGDSTGEPAGFEAVGKDIAAATSALQLRHPEVTGVVLWALCDGASASLLHVDESGASRLKGLCLVNPWVRSEATLAQTQVRHYYLRRLFEPAFWAKLIRMRVHWRAIIELVRAANLTRQAVLGHSGQPPGFQDRMLRGWSAAPVPTLLVLSGRDYTAREFEILTSQSLPWRTALTEPRVECIALPDADHTFSTPSALQALCAATVRWLKRVAPESLPGSHS